MKGAKIRYVSGKNTAVTIKGLKKGRKYYVRITPLKKYKGREYSGQSTLRSVRTK